MSDSSTVPPTGLIIGSKLYDKLKILALVILPAVSTLYFTLGNAWDLPNIEQVIGSIAAVGTFLGSVLGLSSASYKASDARFDGSINVTESIEGVKLFTLELDGNPEDLENKDAILFRIRSDQLPEG
jgi:hypothetical protein